jgi:hypothetical protein
MAVGPIDALAPENQAQTIIRSIRSLANLLENNPALAGNVGAAVERAEQFLASSAGSRIAEHTRREIEFALMDLQATAERIVRAGARAPGVPARPDVAPVVQTPLLRVTPRDVEPEPAGAQTVSIPGIPQPVPLGAAIGFLTNAISQLNNLSDRFRAALPTDQARMFPQVEQGINMAQKVLSAGIPAPIPTDLTDQLQSAVDNALDTMSAAATEVPDIVPEAALPVAKKKGITEHPLFWPVVIVGGVIVYKKFIAK